MHGGVKGDIIFRILNSVSHESACPTLIEIEVNWNNNSGGGGIELDLYFGFTSY